MTANSPVPIDHAVIMVGADAVPVPFHRLAGQIGGKRHACQKFFMTGIHCVKVCFPINAFVHDKLVYRVFPILVVSPSGQSRSVRCRRTHW